MADIENGEPEVIETPKVVEPYESEGARYIRVRAEAKAEAAITMAAEAKAAQKAKAKRYAGRNGSNPELEDFHKRAAEVEKSINAKSTDTKEG